MAEKGFKRKLAAILSADVEGYSRLMDDNEEATVRTLTTYRNAIADLVQQYRGRVVDSPGDNLLAEFASVVDAVNCAVEIQRDLAERNAELPYGRKMEFRIGVNLGDVIEEEGRIYGDGVNITARVESLSEAGGICVSGRAYDQIANKLGLEYENLGEHQVKNISTPIRVYRVLSFPGAAAHRVKKAKRTERRKWLKRILVISTVVILFFLVIALVIWNTYFRLPTIRTGFDAKLSLTLPIGPKIAVMPFVNMSGDPDQEYFCDGITENILMGLSNSPRLFVIARDSTFAFKGKHVPVQQVASELGVRYVVEGSVQKANERVRITVQLIDTATGYHIFAERYDRIMKDIFVLQDEITTNVMTALEVKLTEGEQARWRYKGSANIDVFIGVLKALAYFRQMNKEGNILARQTLEEVIALDSGNSSIYVLLALTHLHDIWFGVSESKFISFAKANRLLKKAIDLDDSHPDAYAALGYLYLMRKQYENAINAGTRAIALNPNAADAYALLGLILFGLDRQDEAIKACKNAIHLNPIPPSHYWHFLGHSLRAAGQYKEAIVAYKKALERQPKNLFARLGLAGVYILVGREKEARSAAEEILKIDPQFSLANYAKMIVLKNQDKVELFIEALRKAGLK